MQPGLVGTGGAGLTGSQVLVTYASEEDAATAQRFLNRSLHGTHRITVAYAQGSPHASQLQPPVADRMLLISPPPSPPEGWQPVPEPDPTPVPAVQERELEHGGAACAGVLPGIVVEGCEDLVVDQVARQRLLAQKAHIRQRPA